MKIQLPTPSDVGKLATIVTAVFSVQECKELIAMTERKGYEQALVNAGGGRQVLRTDIRRSSRCIVDSKERASEIWKRVKQHVPEEWECQGETWSVVGLNERLRFLRYYSGDYFAPHFDGSFARDDEQSFITLMLYLNDDCVGGETAFINMYTDAKSRVKPSPGQVLIFQHNILHSGEPVTKGVKYVVRTDVMYSKKKT